MLEEVASLSSIPVSTFFFLIHAWSLWLVGICADWVIDKFSSLFKESRKGGIG
jgi:hypothetical protein